MTVSRNPFEPFTKADIERMAETGRNLNESVRKAISRFNDTMERRRQRNPEYFERLREAQYQARIRHERALAREHLRAEVVRVRDELGLPLS